MFKANRCRITGKSMTAHGRNVNISTFRYRTFTIHIKQRQECGTQTSLKSRVYTRIFA